MRRKHMHFVDHVDLVAGVGGRVHGALQKLRHFFDRAVARSVDFDVVDESPFVDGAARFTLAAGVRRHASLAVFADAVEAFGQNARERGLANAARSRKEIGVMKTIFVEGVL